MLDPFSDTPHEPDPDEEEARRRLRQQSRELKMKRRAELRSDLLYHAVCAIAILVIVLCLFITLECS